MVNICKNMDLKFIMQNDTGQSKTNTVWSHLHMESKKIKTTKLIDLIDAENKLVASGGGWGMGKEQ